VASNMTVTTNSAEGRGVTVLSGSRGELHNVTLHTAGVAANALYSYNFNTNAPNTILVDGGSLTADQSTAIRVAGATATITLQNGVVVNSGLNRLMDVLPQSGAPVR